jgi:hypothetical protein
MIANTVTVARVTNRSVRARKSDALLVAPYCNSQALLPEIARRRDGHRYQIHWAASQ